MRAIVIHAHGGPEVMRYEDVPTPVPAANEVLVKIHTAGVNHLDLDVRQGVAGYQIPLPHVMGSEGAGEVVAFGREVTAFRAGDRVMPASALSSGSCRHLDCRCQRGLDNLCHNFGRLGLTCWGTFAEYIAVAPHNLVRLPDGLSFETAAAGRTTFSTAWELAINQGGVREGETVVVNGAGGGVGTAAIQVVKRAGARVIATVGSRDKAGRVLALGADAVVNYREDDMAAEIRRLTHGQGADLAIETVGGPVLKATIEAMAPGGRIAIAGAHAGEQVTIDIVKLFRRQIRILTTSSYPKATTATVFGELAKGHLKPVVAAAFPLAEASEAVELLAGRTAVGKILLHG